MQFYIGYFFGVITSGLLLSAGYYLSLWQYVPPSRAQETVPKPRFFPHRGEKRTPKFISEEQQAERERKTAMSDVEKLKERHYPGE